MSRVFVTGATGYIGNAVARALRDAGHTVVGLARSPAKADALRATGIEAVTGDITDPASYAEAAAQADVLVHAAADGARGAVEPDRIAVDALLAAGSKTLLYTSGVWVHGDTGHHTVDEDTPLRPAARVAWRPAHEVRVRSAGGVVLRPGCVYGGAGGLTAAWFEAARDGEAQLVGTGENHWAMVHLDDLARAYVAAARSGLRGETLILAEPAGQTVLACAEAAMQAAGVEPRVVITPVEDAARTLGTYAECLALDQHVSSARAARLLGWTPRSPGFVTGVAEHHAAWYAAR